METSNALSKVFYISELHCKTAIEGGLYLSEISADDLRSVFASV